VGKPEGKTTWKTWAWMRLYYTGSSSSVIKGTDWIDLDQDLDRWRALMNEVINVWIEKTLCKPKSVPVRCFIIILL